MSNAVLDIKPNKPTRVKKIQSRKIKDNFQLFLLTVPALLCFILFAYLPMFGVVLAFKQFNYSDGIFFSPWVGFDNFQYFFGSQDAWRVARNTVLYNLTFILLGIVASVTVALLLYEVKRKVFVKLFQTAMTLPRFLSWVVVSYISYMLLDPSKGILNQIITFFGGTGIQWYSDPKYWPVILTLFHIWKCVGMDCIIYYAALMGVDSELFEAAQIDGANRFQQIIYISIPSIVPVITILFILAVGGIFGGDFGMFYQLPRDVGSLYPTTDIIPTYVFRGLQGGNFEVASAVGLFQSVVGFVLVVITNMIVKKIDPERALF